MRTIRTTSIVVLSLVACLFARDTAAQGGGAEADSIVQLTESVFRRGNQSNTFMVTDEGIIVVDGTCSGGGQQWLKEELARRYDVPVKPGFPIGCGTFAHAISRHALIFAGFSRETRPRRVTPSG